MEVILLERIRHLGQMGDVVAVKPGYARNYLLPQGKALRANKANLTYFEAQKQQLEAKSLEAKAEADAVAAKMEGLGITLIRQAAESGQLYGSVATRDVADAVDEAGFSIKKNQVILEHPIKTIGLHEVLIHLHPEVDVTVAVNVARSEQEAEAQIAETAAVPEEVEEMFETKELAERAEEELAAEAEAGAEAEAEAEVETGAEAEGEEEEAKE